MQSASLWCRVLLVAFVSSAVACSDDETTSEDAPSIESDAGAREPDSGTADKGDAATSTADGQDDLAPIPEDEALPIVFVHGFAGSAQQFQSQAQRFVMNGYPSERLRAYEHDGVATDIPGFVVGLDAVIDEVRETFGTEKVFLMGHSRGTSVSLQYLSDAARAAKVEKYVALDGAGCEGITVPCVAPAQTTNTRPGQTDPLPGQKHVEVATSKESFVVQFKHFFGREPKLYDIVKQKQPVVISGRAVNFPANTGREGVTLEHWELDDNGKRVGSEPKATFELAADGAWGPVTVDPEKRYEQVLLTPDSPNQHHFYAQPFLRSSKFVRLLSGPPDAESRLRTNTSERHAALVLIRMREWTGDDKVEVSTESDSGSQDAKNIITADVGNAASMRPPISIFVHDDKATPEESSLSLLDWFPMQAFQTGVDLFMPANETPDGTITIVNTPRGDESKLQTLRIPNWASSKHTLTLMFDDFPRD
jgi:pimeloyl-ACP methyl ester carboxylesterase